MRTKRLDVRYLLLTVVGCAPGQMGAMDPQACDGRWAVEVTNGLYESVDVLLRTDRYSAYYEAGEFRVLGEVLERDTEVFYPAGRRQPEIMVRTQDDLFPVRLHAESPVTVRVYCER